MTTGAAVPGPDGALRCPWGVSTEDYVPYHDEEWGRPVHGDDALFERLSLEAFQSGLSWITILRRREGFRRAFADFKISSVAAFTDADAERLLADPGIIRNRAKVAATLANAKVLAEWSPGELDTLIWSYAPDPGSRPAPRTLGDVPAVTDESTALAKALKKRGIRFVGPTTAYALMQACGLVNDHLADCVARNNQPVRRLRTSAPPSSRVRSRREVPPSAR
ncbi:DNA-3-methyladenine glycosylase I [Streptomyces sp. NPDC002851]